MVHTEADTRPVLGDNGIIPRALLSVQEHLDAWSSRSEDEPEPHE